MIYNALWHKIILTLGEVSGNIKLKKREKWEKRKEGDSDALWIKSINWSYTLWGIWFTLRKRMKKMKRKVFYKIFATLFALTVIATIGTSSVDAAGNYKDSHERVYYDNDGCSRGSTSRSKLDYTSAYMKITTSSDIGVYYVDVVGTTTKSPITYFIPDANLCTAGTAKTINIGEAKYLPNYVKERGYSYCNLNYEIPYYGTCYIDFLWSPDSI